MGLGVLVGLVPVTSAGADCGSALLQEERLSVALVAGEAAADSCQSLLSVLVIPVWALIGLGLLAFGNGVHARNVSGAGHPTSLTNFPTSAIDLANGMSSR